MNDAKLTYLYLLCVVAWLLSSCTSETNVDFGKGAEMSFDVSEQTRAAVSTDISEFAVYGDMKFPADDTTSPVVVFNNTKVEYTGDSWTYSGVQYWFPKHEHSFVAVHPLSVLETANNPQYLNSKLSFSYTIPTSDDDNVANMNDVSDIIVATHRRLYNFDDHNSTTVFRFGHIMSLLNFAPALDDNGMKRDDYIEFHKLEFSGVNTKARFDILPASRLSNKQTDDMMVDVTGQEAGNLVIEFATPVKVMNDARNTCLFADSDAIIMLPQGFAADSVSEIVFYYTINEDQSMKEVSIPLNNQKWEFGKSYVYKFKIERSRLTLDKCEISPWNVVKGADITVD